MKTKTGQDKEELNLIKLAQQYSDEDKARTLLETLRWPNGVICPHCKANGSVCKDVYRLTPKASSKAPARKGLFSCAACRKQFSVTVGTVFEGSHIPISKWLMAIFILCSSKKSVSAHQLHRMLGITYKSAWFMAHRIRFAMGSSNHPGNMLEGEVEADETFVGGKGEIRTHKVRKTPVVAMIERGGNVKTKVVSSVSQHNLARCLHECVRKDAVVLTDEHPAYPGVLKYWKVHHSVHHTSKEYYRVASDGSEVHTNTCESFFSLLKRGVHGSWHHVSREHLPKYASEFEFRWNTRHETDGERMTTFTPMIEGKRLLYRQPV